LQKAGISLPETVMSFDQAGKASQHILDLLAEDHARILKLFDDFRMLRSGEETDGDRKQRVVESACAALIIHAQVEEEIFYPALRSTPEGFSLVEEAEVEHAATAAILAELEWMDPEEPLYDAKFKVLGEYLRHHVAEEESRLFTQARRAGIALAPLGERLFERMEALKREFAMPEEEEEQETLLRIRAAAGIGLYGGAASSSDAP
jgi:hypothetical protein